MKKQTLRECPVCGHRQAEPLHSLHFVLTEDKNLAPACDVVACDRCGTAFADTPVTQREYDDLYAKRSRYAAGPAAHSTVNERDIGRFRDMAMEIESVVPDRSSRIADIGCANGQMLSALSALGYRCLTGVDPSPACVQHVNRIPGVEAFVGSLSDLASARQPFDIIVLSHVVEHVRDLKPALAHVQAHLNSAGIVYVEVPDASRYVDFVWSPFQDFNSEHINHFSLTSLANLLRRAGFAPFRSGSKEILSAPGMPYPAIFWFARRDPEAGSEIEKDPDLRDRLLDYVRVSKRLMHDIDTRLREALPDGAPVIVWGTGELTAKLLADTELGRANLVAFVDSNPINQGQRLRGLPILPPQELRSSGTTIVVASILHHDSIAAAIRDLGLQNPVLRLPCRISASAS